jgi:hypothetical protein
MNDIDFSQYLIKDEQPISKNPPVNDIDFSKFLIQEPPQKKEPSALGEVIPQAAKGFVSSKGGFLGDVLDLIKAQPKETLPGETAQRSLEHDILTKMQQPGYIPSIGELDILSEQEPSIPRFSRFPSSKDVKETIGQLGGPGEAQTFAGKSAERTGELLGLGVKKIPAALAAISGQSAKELGLSPTAQFAAELLPMLVSSISIKNGLQGAEKYASSKYAQADSLLPQSAQVMAVNLQKKFNDLKKMVSKGTMAPSEKFIVDEVDAVLNKVKDGKINVAEAVASKRSLNEKVQNFIYTSPEKASKARARKLSTQISKELDSVIESYGKENPKFLKTYREANDAFGALAQSKTVSKFINKHAPKYAPHTAGGILAEIIFRPDLLGPTIATAGIGTILVKSGELLYRVLKSPTLSKYYFGVIKEATKENIPAMLNQYRKLDEGMKKDIRIKQMISK